MSGFTLPSATLLAQFHYPLPWIAGQVLVFPSIYVAGIWGSILLCLVFIGAYAWRVAEEARQLARVGHALEIQRQIQHMGGQRGVPVRGQRGGGGFQFGGARRQRGGIGQVHGRAFAANEADAFI